MADAVIIVFLRLPVPGQVKTRLAATVGPDAACCFYKLCAQHILHTCTMVPGCKMVAQHSCKDSTGDVAAWMDSLKLQLQPQILPQSPDPNLGVKLQEALKLQLDQSSTGKVLVVGTDIPDLSPGILTAALEALDKYEVVIGPAQDGGYYLLGLTRPAPQLFPQDMPWSTSAVLQRTLEAASSSGLHVAPLDTLPSLQDIDTFADLQAWFASRAEAHSQNREDSMTQPDTSNASQKIGRSEDDTPCGAVLSTGVLHSSSRDLVDFSAEIVNTLHVSSPP